MRNHIRTLLAPALLALAPLVSAACASSGAPKAPVDPNAPVDLDGARYKLVESRGALDQRMVEFAVAGETIRGCLVTFGMKLRNVTGLDVGVPVITAKKTANPNEYAGVYKSIEPDGQMADKEVTLTFVGGEMRWNLESATWSRQDDMKLMNAEEKKRCGVK
jgi:hypothetical protein